MDALNDFILLFINATVFNQPESLPYQDAIRLHQVFVNEVQTRWGEHVAREVRNLRRGRIDSTILKRSSSLAGNEEDDWNRRKSASQKKRKLNDGRSKRKKFSDISDSEDEESNLSDSDSDDEEDDNLVAVNRKRDDNVSKIEKILGDRVVTKTVTL